MRIQVVAVAAALFLASLTVVWSFGQPGGEERRDDAQERGATAPDAQPGVAFPGAATATGAQASGTAAAGTSAGSGRYSAEEAVRRSASREAAARLAKGSLEGDGQAAAGASGGEAELLEEGSSEGDVQAAAEDAELLFVSRDEAELLEESSFEDDVRTAIEEAYALLHSADPDQRIDGIQELAFHDPELARLEIERLLANEGNPDVRLAAYEELLSLIEVDAERVDWMVRGLADRADGVREHIAYQVSSEDTDTYPQLVSAMHNALNAERNPNVYDQVESSLELMDSSFVPRYMRELEEPLEDFEFVELGTDPDNG
jgi:hypothetical protein